MVLRKSILILLLWLPGMAWAQNEWWSEMWVEETGDEEAVAEMSDLMQQLQAQPVNINDTQAVAELPFISPFQRKALRNYILLHGQLLSLDELFFVPGFDSATVDLLKRVTVAMPYSRPKQWRLAEGRHSLISGLGGTVEQAAGYRNGHYEGDNLRSLLCYRFQLHEQMQLRVVADKDPTEPWGKNSFYGYHLMLNHIGRLERLIVGRYNLQFGQGLTLWTGLRPFNFMGGSAVRYASGLRPASAFYEEGYQEGAGAKVNLGRGWHATAFGSLVQGETLAGSHLEYRSGNLIVGLTAAYSALGDSMGGGDYLYNQLRFRGQRQLNTGIDAMYQWGRLTVYGEAAMGENGALAALAGMNLHAGDGVFLGMSLRHYDREYHNLHASGYTLGSTQGEQGVAFNLGSRLPWGMRLLANVDLFRFNMLRYANYRPSTGSWLRLQLEKDWGGHFSATMRYTYRQGERNVPNLDSMLYVGEETVKQQLQAGVRWHSGRWILTGRAIYSLFDSEEGSPQQGWLASVTARYQHGRWQADAGAAWFDVEGYYARIYLGESNLQYAWSMPALYGEGLRLHTVLRYRWGTHLTMAAKYALTYMPGQESIGSSHSLTEGPLRQTWFVQVRLTI